jgi:TIR domain
MSDEQIQIFISYARDDDEPAPDIAGTMGFVDFLHRQLDHSFKSGRERPEIWRDVKNIFRGERFWPKIQLELDKSALLLVILSENWMASEYCRKELAYFRECRNRSGEEVDERIVVIAKNDVELQERPEGLKNTEGYSFYQHIDRPRLGEIEEFFVRGRPVENLYWPMFDELRTFLCRRSKQLRRTSLTEPEASTNGRTVYVAKPASDMLDDYIGLVKELTDHGYEVVPKRAQEMPRDRSALNFIDTALGAAEASIHLVGESAGWEPEDLDKIVELQLARAAAKVDDGKDTKPRSAFRRIIWAPKVFRRALPAGIETMERDPHEVLARFGGELPIDQVIGEDPGNFRQLLIRMLDQWKPAVLADEAVGGGVAAGSRVFVLHNEQDRLLARNLKKALRQHNVEALLPAVDDDEALRKTFDKDSIARCDAIVLCWGMTSQTWTCAQARQFEDWRAFGRNRGWKPRSVVLAPPSGEIKAEFKQDPLPREIDQLVELDDINVIPPDVVSRIIPRSRAEEP